MKYLYATALLAVGGLLVAPTVAAQACTGSAGTINTPSGNIVSNSCGTQDLVNACAGSSGAFTGEGDDIYEVTVGSGTSYSFTITATGGTSPTWYPWLGYIATTCSSSTGCVNSGGTTVSAANDPDVTIPTSGSYDDVATPAGTYYLIVSSVAGSGNGCGDYSLDWGPTLPVEMQSFSVN